MGQWTITTDPDSQTVTITGLRIGAESAAPSRFVVPMVSAGAVIDDLCAMECEAVMMREELRRQRSQHANGK